jgi:hypothetical protein
VLPLKDNDENLLGILQLINKTNEYFKAIQRGDDIKRSVKEFEANGGKRSSDLRSGVDAGNFNVPPPSEESRTLWEIAIDQQNRFAEAAKKARFEAYGKNQEDIDALASKTEAWISFAQGASNAIAGIIAADKDFGASIKKTAASIIQQNAVLIASWLALKFVKDATTKNVALATAGLAVALGVVSGLLGKDWKKGNASASVRSFSGERMTTQNIVVTGVIRGQDIYISNQNYMRNNRSTSFIGG